MIAEPEDQEDIDAHGDLPDQAPPAVADDAGVEAEMDADDAGKGA